jgi:cytochrome P450
VGAYPADPAALDACLTDLAFWARPPAERMAAFARLREQDRPVFFAEQRVPLVRSGGGFYALVRHSDVTEASRNPRVFSSEPAAASPEPPPWIPLVLGRPMVNMDGPGHARLRRIVARAFTPRRLALLDELTRLAAARIVDEMAAQGPGNFVTQVARQLPVQMIGAMMGIPERYQGLIAARVAAMTAYSGVRADLRRPGTLRLLAGNLEAIAAFRRLVVRLGRERRREPGDDLLSALVSADAGGERLSIRELGSFFDLLLVASTETTSNAIAHGLRLFTGFPAQRELLMSDFDARIGGAVEETIRYASPIIQFRRTLTCDYQMRGHAFAKGDKVVMFYLSANHDESVFDHPAEFDITRCPNPHVGFGGGGPHQCIGAHLARREITAIYRELFARFPGIRAVGEPELLLSSFDNGITHLGFELGLAGGGAPPRVRRARRK